MTPTLIDEIELSVEKWAEKTGTDTATVDVLITVFYKKGKGAKVAAYIKPSLPDFI